MNRIKAYTKQNCPKCDRLKEILKDVNHNAEVSILDSSVPENLAWLKSKGLNSVPIVAMYNDKGEELMVVFGFTKSNIANKYMDHTGGNLFG